MKMNHANNNADTSNCSAILFCKGSIADLCNNANSSLYYDLN